MVKLGDYQHFKGTKYIVVCLARDSETEERMVVYTKAGHDYWVRSEKMFEEEVLWPDGIRRPRFVRLDGQGELTVVTEPKEPL